MPLTIDPARAREVGERLHRAFHGGGILGQVSMPEHILPPGVERGSREQIHFITLTVAIDYMRDADKLWAAARETMADPATRYLFNPRQVVQTGVAKLRADMHQHRLALRPQKDLGVWQTICQTLVQHFQGDVHNLLQQAGFRAPTLLATIRGQRYRFPNLRGDKIGPLWVRMLEDSWQGHHFTGLEQLPIPVDIHIAAATVMTGGVRGPFAGAFEELREAVVQVWFDACRGTRSYPLQFDEPLWHLSRRGCRDTRTFPCVHQASCPVAAFCTATEVKAGSAAAGGATAVQLVAH